MCERDCESSVASFECGLRNAENVSYSRASTHQLCLLRLSPPALAAGVPLSLLAIFLSPDRVLFAIPLQHDLVLPRTQYGLPHTHSPLPQPAVLTELSARGTAGTDAAGTLANSALV